MADISKIILPDETSLDIKDSTARAGLTNKLNITQGVQYKGKILGIGDDGNITPVDAASGSGDVTGPNSSTDDHVATFDGVTGKVIQDSGFTIGASVPADAVFTDTTYESKTAASGGTDVSLVTTGEKYTWNSKTDNVGTVTGVKMNNGSDISPDANGIVDLGTVITEHQSLSGKLDTSLKGANNGLAELDANGKVPSSQLPSYVDDVLEYADEEHFPLTGETGKIYIALDTNKTYRWSGSAYTEISASLALGETSSTAYRGDRGKTAYDHATDSSRLTTAQSSGLYKIATTAEGHIASVTAVQKSDITDLDIPGSQPDITGKADKVASATSGDVATLDGNGNLVDSGKTLGVSVPSNAVFTDTTYSAFTGAGASTAGASGLVPAPAGGDNEKYLKGDGTWGAVSGGSSLDTITVTALSSGWTGNTAPYTQTITATGVTSSNTIFVSIGVPFTTAQKEAMEEANILCTAQGANSITLTAYVAKPDIDLPINVAIAG